MNLRRNVRLWSIAFICLNVVACFRSGNVSKVDGGADVAGASGGKGGSVSGGNGGASNGDANSGSGGSGGATNAVGIGLPCSSGSDCASTFCADGVCCESACNGACEACGEVGTKGMCVPVTGTPHAGHPACAGTGTPCAGTCDGASRICGYPGAEQSCRAASCTTATATLAASCDGKGACAAPETVDCAPNVCAGSICGGGCSDAQPCMGTNYCSAGKCVPKKAMGQTCQTAGECAGGACADGYCCNTACTGSCMACNLAGLLGTCSPVKAAIDGTCNGMQMCDATGTCKKANGQTCTAAAECTSEACVDGHCCGVASCGACQACTGGGGMCVAVTSAEDADSCSGTKICDATGACKPKGGQPCTLGTQCVSGFCADGVCCNTACTGQCESCAEATSTGTCVAVSGAPRTGHTACAGAGSTCGGMCGGTNRTACIFPGASTSCRAGSCTNSTATLDSSCDGKGACPAGVTQPCAPNTCAGTACAGGCSGTQPCTGTNFCSGGMCIPKKANGMTCGAAGGNAECTSNACVDGFCCGSPSCGTCQACTGTGGTCVAIKNADDADSCTGATGCDAAGVCKKKTGQTCLVGGDCVTGNCADGVCCNSACTGQCESCAEAATKGTCTAVSGAPRTGHAACAGSGPPCGGMCDGTNRTTCAYPGGTVSCRTASCSSGTATLAANCDAKGACPALQTQTCAPNTCAGTACAGGCSATQPCVAGNYCNAGVCTAKKANGQPCGAGGNSECTNNVCLDGFCCGSPSCGTCQACTGAGGTCVAIKNADDPNSCNGATSCDAAGVCKKKIGQACSVGGDCLMGFCVDSVCCSRACNGSCEICNGSSPGTCTVITGAPRAGHPPCTGSGACVGTCQGAASCTESRAMCSPPQCVDHTDPARYSEVINAAYCNGGTCPAATITSCRAYVCQDTTSCFTRCTWPDSTPCSGGGCQEDNTCNLP